MTISDEIMRQFSVLCSELSPENLSHDGELSQARVNARRKALIGKWHALEKRVGRQVSESEVWEWEQEQSGKTGKFNRIPRC